MYDAAVTAESSSEWSRVVERWKECVNETLKQTDECRAQCVVASQRLPEETDSVEGVYEKAAGERSEQINNRNMDSTQENQLFFLFCKCIMNYLFYLTP